MSLKSYLFALIGALIVLLTLSQLALVFWIESTLEKEVAEKARNLSKQVIDLVIERIDDQDNQDNQPGSTPKEADHDGNTFSDPAAAPRVAPIVVPKKIENQQKMLVIQQHPLDKRLLKEQLNTLIDKIHESNINKKSATAESLPYPQIIYKQTGKRQQLSINNNTVNEGTKTLIESIKLAIICSAIIALLFAYWLSTQFSKPLKQLALGFKQLASGDYQHTVPVQGVSELSSTIVHYNNMVSKLAELSLAQQQHKEVAHLAELGEVSRGLAHALRSPIHTIGLSIEQLSSDDLTQTQKKQILAIAQDKIANIDKNIKALLTLTTQGITRNENISVLAVVQDILLEYKTGQHKKQQFKVEISKVLTITAAEIEIRSILHTLIINACEANPVDGLVTITATESATNKPQAYLTINIVDVGPGLETKIAGKLFHPHVSTKASGAGMGLYIAKRIISLHYQGDITLCNNPGQQGCIASASFKQEQEL